MNSLPSQIENIDLLFSSVKVVKLQGSLPYNFSQVDRETGEICLQSDLDYEKEYIHHLTVVAVDRVSQGFVVAVYNAFVVVHV